MTASESPARKPAIGLGSAARDLYRALWRHAHGVRRHLLGAAALLSAAQLLRLTMPWLAAQAINALQQGEMTTAGRWIVYLVGVYLLSWLLHGPGRILERNVGVRVRERLADQLYARIAAAPLAWRDGRHSGELQHRVVQSSRALSDFAQNQFGYLQSAFNFVGPIVALALLSRTSGAIAVTGYVIIALIILRFDRALMQLARAENDAERRYAAALLDFVGNAATVIGLRLQAASRKVLGRRMGAVMAPLRRAVVVNEGKWFAVDLLGMGLTWILVVVYVLQSRQPGQAVLLGTVFMIYQYAQQAATVVGAMAANFQSFARMHTDYGSAEPIWAAPGDPGAAVPAIAPDAAWQTLALRGVSWRYADDARGGLHGVDLVLRRGERVALVGPSGGGKSTLLRALAGLYLPQHGVLLRDGDPVDWGALRTLATLIPQEADVFEASVEENLTFGEPAGAPALQAAVHAGVFDDVLRQLPDGLKSAVNERGSNFSGGQRQRLALARGVLAAKGSSLLLLDEPTSALDPLAEGRVFDRMYEAFPTACIVASVHRPSLLERFDTIVVMEAGRVVDAGARDDVLARRT
ncbi:ABC transporter ATP-binding protein [Pandoraea nosoerga]|uniref:Multidrug ABC transporter ATP-binding protein n=1 Tax=Pandoraea nosoerga TaxID=2508296 RepID=A0A5E4SNA4_9BURK|nr:ABC transporter ATP-binding protein [Pandoraea nosoerga]MBN4665234.1 ABC transporter ATP-binding protein [Pandoraea nosoerga]MBN4674635.1 ABC transporter ATP-binding protein [Pandoraea nosoerga]MBN4680523.1 ABC transporter ATP-binding protein [Pandoraea nosoerga]MBN4743929.1 ABC transporter ATP-binding protein [Pandoraea nosoerga]VVD76412.1 multidrug ABC transporter ATP-binding protein [Pandoraea nosoerga]